MNNFTKYPYLKYFFFFFFFWGGGGGGARDDARVSNFFYKGSKS